MDFSETGINKCLSFPLPYWGYHYCSWLNCCCDSSLKSSLSFSRRNWILWHAIFHVLNLSGVLSFHFLWAFIPNGNLGCIFMMLLTLWCSWGWGLTRVCAVSQKGKWDQGSCLARVVPLITQHLWSQVKAVNDENTTAKLLGYIPSPKGRAWSLTFRLGWGFFLHNSSSK